LSPVFFPVRNPTGGEDRRRYLSPAQPMQATCVDPAALVRQV
jgi:hypothetical protein